MRTSGVFIPTFEDWVPAVSFLEVSTKFRENVHNIWRRAVKCKRFDIGMHRYIAYLQRSSLILVLGS